VEGETIMVVVKSPCSYASIFYVIVSYDRRKSSSGANGRDFLTH
jgi:hypothetical protein